MQEGRGTYIDISTCFANCVHTDIDASGVGNTFLTQKRAGTLSCEKESNVHMEHVPNVFTLPCEKVVTLSWSSFRVCVAALTTTVPAAVDAAAASNDKTLITQRECSNRIFKESE